MSVYIPGMEMPNGCFYCIFNKHLDPDTDICRLTRDAFDSTFRVVEHRRDNCPLVPVPEHGALIDRDDFFAECSELVDGYKRITDDFVVIPADKEGEG